MKKIFIIIGSLIIICSVSDANPLLGHWEYKRKGIPEKFIIYFKRDGIAVIKKFISVQGVPKGDLIEKDCQTYRFIVSKVVGSALDIILSPEKQGDIKEGKIYLSISIGKYGSEIDDGGLVIRGNLYALFSGTKKNIDTMQRISRIFETGAVQYYYRTINEGFFEETISDYPTRRVVTLKNPKMKFRVLEIPKDQHRLLIEFIVERTNQFRKSQKKSVLQNESILEEAVDKQLRYLSCEWINTGKSFLSHSQHDSSSCYTGSNVSLRIGISSSYTIYCGENLHFRDLTDEYLSTESVISIRPERLRMLADLIITSWEKSPGHRTNMMDESYASMGANICLVEGTLDDGYIDVNGKYHDLVDGYFGNKHYKLIAGQVFSSNK